MRHLLALSVLSLPATCSLPIEDRPFVHIESPDHFACLALPPGGSPAGGFTSSLQVGLVHSGSAESAAALSGSFVCLAVHSRGAQTSACAALVGGAVPQFSGLGPGCHTALSWWESSDRLERGSAHSVLFQVADAGTGLCPDSCTDPDAPKALSHVTGGCLNNPHDGSAAGGCCPEGCCEFVNRASQCSSLACELPACNSCLGGTLPGSTHALTDRLPEPGRTAATKWLELVKATVLNSVASPAPEKVDGHVWPEGDSPALSMVGQRRLDHFHALLDDVLLRRVPGDVAECGCWKGGVAAVASAVLLAAGELKRAADPNTPSGAAPFDASTGVLDVDAAAAGGGSVGRVVWLLDSFRGLPELDLASYPADLAHVLEAKHANDQVLGDNSARAVKEALERVGVFDPQGTRLVEGFFNESLPAALRRGELGRLAVLRLDGDLYASTIEALHYLYPSLSLGGHVIVDDFTDWAGCRQAVADFRLVHGLGGDKKVKGFASATEPLQVVWHDVLKGEQVRGVWWTKTRHLDYAPLEAGGLKPEGYAAAAKTLRRLQSAGLA